MEASTITQFLAAPAIVALVTVITLLLKMVERKDSRIDTLQDQITKQVVPALHDASAAMTEMTSITKQLVIDREVQRRVREAIVQAKADAGGEAG